MLRFFNWLMFKILSAFERPKFGTSICVYFPKEGRAAYAQVTSMKKSLEFNARIISEVDVDVAKSYGQLDNDVRFWMDSREPVDCTKGKKSR